ncbi:MAG: hypothetical protein RR199_03805 [Alistipes sp.]
MRMKIGVKFWVLALVALVAASCGESSKNEEGTMMPNSWKLTSWAGSAAAAGKVYLQLNSDHSFTLYQSIDAPGFTKFTGTYTIAKDGQNHEILSGKYTDNTAWESSYLIQSQTDKTMVLKSLNDDTISEYAAAVLPEELKAAVSRAAVSQKPFM